MFDVMLRSRPQQQVDESFDGMFLQDRDLFNERDDVAFRPRPQLQVD